MPDSSTALAQKTDFESIKERLAASLQGQPEAVEVMAEVLEMCLLGFTPVGRPAASIFLMGPTGVGKTFTPELVAEFLHGTRSKVLRINCGEYQMSHEVAKLVGAPPGYLGHKETQARLGSESLERLRSDECKYAVICFDEIEKANEALFKILLSILDKGSIYTGDNKETCFENTLIFFTSNVGTREAERALRGYGFSSNGDEAASEKAMKAALNKLFSKEFLNRLDYILTYKRLDKAAVKEILEQERKAFEQYLTDKKHGWPHKVNFSPKLEKFLISEGFSPKFGARELKRVFHKYVFLPIARYTSKPNEGYGRQGPKNLRIDLNSKKQPVVERILASTGRQS